MEHAELYRALILVAIYGGLWSLKQCTVQLREIFCFPLIEKILTTFIQNFFQKLQLLPINEYSKIHPGKIIDDLCRTQENFSCLFMGLFLHTIPTIIEMSIILLILIFYFNIIFSFIFVLFILLLESPKFFV